MTPERIAVATAMAKAGQSGQIIWKTLAAMRDRRLEGASKLTRSSGQISHCATAHLPTSICPTAMARRREARRPQISQRFPPSLSPHIVRLGGKRSDGSAAWQSQKDLDSGHSCDAQRSAFCLPRQGATISICRYDIGSRRIFQKGSFESHAGRHLPPIVRHCRP